MREDYKNDWVTASLVDDLNYLKTGVEEYEGNKDYYSTGSIKDDSIISEGAYTYNGRPSRANRVGRIGDILQARMKDTDKAVFITNELNDQLFSTGFFQIRTDSRTILPKYLFHYFKSIVFLNQKDSNCSGSTQSALNDKSAKNLFVPIAPIPVQRQIVSKIEELFSDLDKGIADLKKAQDQLKVYRQAVLKKAFEGELTKEWREQNRFTKNEWKFPPLGKVLIQSKEKHKPENVENLFYVGLEHIGKETGNLTETVGVSEIKTVKNKFKTGQILYGRLRPYLNKVYLAKESGVCSTDILVFNLENSIIGKFAVQFMLSRQFVNDMSANTNGVNLPRVSTKYVNNYKFPLPPIKEQHQIVQEIESRLSVCDKVEESITESLEKAKALRQSVLKKAFGGTLLSKEEITACKTAPDYEPASVLLEKIKAEKKKK